MGRQRRHQTWSLMRLRKVKLTVSMGKGESGSSECSKVQPVARRSCRCPNDQGDGDDSCVREFRLSPHACDCTFYCLPTEHVDVLAHGGQLTIGDSCYLRIIKTYEGQIFGDPDSRSYEYRLQSRGAGVIKGYECGRRLHRIEYHRCRSRTTLLIRARGKDLDVPVQVMSRH